MNPTMAAPGDIDTSQHFWNAFDHNETEISARWIVRLYQANEWGWDRPFTYEEVQRFYEEQRRKQDRFTFNRLIEPGSAYNVASGHYQTGGGWVIKDGNFYRVTPDFVDRCHRSAPKK